MTETKEKTIKKKKKYRLGILSKILICLVVFNSFIIIFNFFAMPEIKYQKALKLVEEEQYAAAIEAFTNLSNYKDSGAQLIILYDIINSNVKVGSIVYYGSYEQDNDNTNGKEKIAWKVLALENDKALLLSEKNLDCIPYSYEDKATTWETATLRAWLNNEFLNASFTEKEQSVILTSQVSIKEKSTYGTKAGETVEDKIFILSASEAKEFFGSDMERISINTAYAVSRKAFNSPEGNGWWWLRTPGIQENIAANVNYSGTVDEYGNYIYSIGGCVRPVFWINWNNLSE